MGKHNSFISLASAVLLLAGCSLFGGKTEEPQVTASAPPEAAIEAVPAAPSEEPSATEVPPAADSIVGAPETATEAAPAPAPASDDAPRLRTDAPLRYVVKKGDTLWDISGHFLKDPWQWPELWYANPQVENPHLIYPGDELMLVTVDGMPRVVRQAPVADSTPPPPTMPDRQNRVAPTVREQTLEAAIPTIPLDAIRAFLKGPRLVDKDDLDDSPYVLGFDEEHVIGGNDMTAFALKLEDRRYNQYQVVRLGEAYRDPDDNDILGYEAIPVSEAEVRKFGDPATIYITASTIETRPGDHLLPIDPAAYSAKYFPHAPKKRVEGTIISVYNGVTQIGQYQIVALNRGSNHGLDQGAVLSIYKAGRSAKDPYSFFGSKVPLPDSRIGTLLVFQVKPRMSYALIMDATQAVHVLDAARKPEATR